MKRHLISSLAYSALTIAALAFASGPAWAQHGGGGHGGGGGHSGGGHGSGGHGGGGGHGGSGHAGGGGGHWGGGGGAHFSSGGAHWSGGSAGLSGARSFSSPATRGWSSGSWNHGYNNWGSYGHHGYGYDHYHHGFYGGFPWYWGWSGFYPYYDSYPYYNSYPYYSSDYNYVPDYSYSVPSYDYSSADNLSVLRQDSTSPAPQSTVPENAVLIGIRVPDNAQIWIDGERTSQTGTFREFVTPPLEQGQKFNYDIKASWTENGKEVVRDRNLSFFAGDRLTVNMMAPQPTKSASQAAHVGAVPQLPPNTQPPVALPGDPSLAKKSADPKR